MLYQKSISDPGTLHWSLSHDYYASKSDTQTFLFGKMSVYRQPMFLPKPAIKR